jgi:hypothetical protein
MLVVLNMCGVIIQKLTKVHLEIKKLTKSDSIGLTGKFMIGPPAGKYSEVFISRCCRCVVIFTELS